MLSFPFSLLRLLIFYGEDILSDAQKDLTLSKFLDRKNDQNLVFITNNGRHSFKLFTCISSLDFQKQSDVVDNIKYRSHFGEEETEVHKS